MGKIKGWSKNGDIYKNDLSKSSLKVNRYNFQHWEILFINRRGYLSPLGNTFRTKAQAQAFAIRYMKAHPRG